MSIEESITIRQAGKADIANLSRLHAAAFGPGRFARSAYRVREGKGQISRFCLIAEKDGRTVGSARMTEITVGRRHGAALLGPVVVDLPERNGGLGKRLITRALEAAKSADVSLVILVGDEPYYGRYGFKPIPIGQITLPGPVNPARLLACELRAGALADYCGMVVAIPTTELDESSSIAAQV